MKDFDEHREKHNKPGDHENGLDRLTHGIAQQFAKRTTILFARRQHFVERTHQDVAFGADLPTLLHLFQMRGILAAPKLKCHAHEKR
ncbi:hypothetical protein GCM10025858_01920 [Alicyclobacillus sacchari]|nr:hypothetical protein GCM10025858_01920 [Alicyclobacillus sacchari]